MEKAADAAAEEIHSLDDLEVHKEFPVDTQNGEYGEVRPQDDHGICSQESNHLTSSECMDDNVVWGNHSKETEVEHLNQLGRSPLLSAEASSSPTQEHSPGTTAKGYGLKKWRRLRREIPKDATTNLDSIKMLKRHNDGDEKQPSDTSVSSTKAIDQSLGAANGIGLASSSPGYSLPVDHTFSAEADSDNSEDRGSKSSTAASVPRYKHDALRAMGHQRDKQRVKNLGGRNLGSVGPRSQTGKSLAMVDASKKARGESVKIEEENSLSSMESDSRSNFVFIGGTPVIGDQTQREKQINHDVDDADDEPDSEEQSVEEFRADFSKNISVSQDSSSDVNKGMSKNHQLSTDCDPLVNSILMLQSAQAALEKEVQQFGDIGKGIHSFCEDLGENAGSRANPMSLGPEGCFGHTSNGWASESSHVPLNNNAQILETQLGEAEVMLNEKEIKILKLEATIRSMKSPLEDIEGTIQMEAELESLFKQKIEAEVEFVAMTRSTKEWSGVVESHLQLLKAQKSLVTDLENKHIVPKDIPKEVGRESEEIPKMQRRVVKLTKCFFIQLILQLLVFVFFFPQLSPKSAVVVPT